MGTRADFYVGRGDSAEWLGSIGWDGYPEAMLVDIVRPDDAGSCTEAEYRGAVDRFLAEREDATRPAQGWPWPWADSRTTDYAYAFEGGIVYACCFGHRWYRASDPALRQDNATDDKEAVFPDMTARQQIAWDRRSGLLIIHSPR